jgi:hypothetical protein
MVMAQITAALASSLVKSLKKPNGVSSSAWDVGVIAKSCGTRCCEGVVGPVVTVRQAGLLLTPGGGRVVGGRVAADADTARVKPKTATLATRKIMLGIRPLARLRSRRSEPVRASEGIRRSQNTNRGWDP